MRVVLRINLGLALRFPPFCAVMIRVHSNRMFPNLVALDSRDLLFVYINGILYLKSHIKLLPRQVMKSINGEDHTN
jgi:hypothetical protein